MVEPIGAMGLLELAQRGGPRLQPAEALERQQNGEAILIDVRTDEQRAASANLPGALAIDLTVLPWRLDPTFDYRIPEAAHWQVPWVLICRDGYSSAVAAATLRFMGLQQTTDVVGGFAAWTAAGLPTTTEPADIRR